MQEHVEDGTPGRPPVALPSTGLLFRPEQSQLTKRDQGRVDLACVALAVLAAVTVATGMHGPVRWILVAAAVLVVPGASLVSLLPVRDVWAYAGLAIALSLAVSTLGATVLVWIKWLQPGALGTALAVASCVLLLLDYRRLTRTTDGAAA